MSFPRIKRHHWKKRKTIAMYLFRRRQDQTPAGTSGVEIQAENGDFLFSESGSYIITE
jgi:hypothetical protein